MAKKPPPPEEPPDESWMATFADAITLLMAFFVMLLTFAEYDIPAFDEAAAAIAERVGGEPLPGDAQEEGGGDAVQPRRHVRSAFGWTGSTGVWRRS